MGDIFLLAIVGLVIFVAALLFLMFYTEPNNDSTSERAQKLAQDKYNPNQTRFAARKEAKASEARGSLLTNIKYEVEQMADVLVAETRAKMESYRKDDAFTAYSMERERNQADHALHQSMAQNQIQANNVASQLGISPQAFEELVLEKARTETTLAMQRQEMLLEVEKTKLLKQIELDFERGLADLDVKMTNISNLLPQHKLELLHNQLAGIHKEYEQVKLLADGEYKQKELKRLEKKIDSWEQAIYEEET